MRGMSVLAVTALATVLLGLGAYNASEPNDRPNPGGSGGGRAAQLKSASRTAGLLPAPAWGRVEVGRPLVPVSAEGFRVNVPELKPASASGVYVASPDNPAQVSLYSERGQGAVLAFYQDATRNGLPGLAVYANDSGCGFQVVDDRGKVHFVPASALLKLVGEEKAGGAGMRPFAGARPATVSRDYFTAPVPNCSCD